MSEEPLERSRRTIDDARHAADEAREAEPFHRDADEGTGRQATDAETATDEDATGSDEQAP